MLFDIAQALQYVGYSIIVFVFFIFSIWIITFIALMFKEYVKNGK